MKNFFKRLHDWFYSWAERRVDDMSLDEAMLVIVGHVGAKDSFCVRENEWCHSGQFEGRRFQVSIFKGEELATQIEGPKLGTAVRHALAQWDAHKAPSAT